MIKNNHRILILLSTYNGEEYLKEQLDSLESQVGVYLNYLIRDDGSTDNTKNILNQFAEEKPNIELIFGDNIGSANSYKELLVISKKYLHIVDFFSFCDQDDIWLKDKLMIAANRLEKMPFDTPAMYCSNLTLIDENKEIGEMHKAGLVIFSKGRSLVESISTGCTMVFNKKTIQIFNNKIPQYITIHDLWIYHMCIFLGEVYYDPTPNILYRQHNNNEIGAKHNFNARWKSRFKSIKTLSKQHYREWEAKELLEIYDEYLSNKDKELIKTVAFYRQDFRKRLTLLWPSKQSDIKMTNWELNFWLKLRIIIGKV
ncbi:MAG TPA: hypothetical protein DCG75_14355 [Bacteroidales bacterium]|nr:hypothetical protein [Bacteroidales bacterium]